MPPRARPRSKRRPHVSLQDREEHARAFFVRRLQAAAETQNFSARVFRRDDTLDAASAYEKYLVRLGQKKTSAHTDGELCAYFVDGEEVAPEEFAEDVASSLADIRRRLSTYRNMQKIHDRVHRTLDVLASQAEGYAGAQKAVADAREAEAAVDAARYAPEANAPAFFAYHPCTEQDADDAIGLLDDIGRLAKKCLRDHFPFLCSLTGTLAGIHRLTTREKKETMDSVARSLNPRKFRLRDANLRPQAQRKLMAKIAPFR